MTAHSRRLAALSVLVMSLAACGGGGEGTRSERSTREQAKPATRRVVLPDVKVRDVATGEALSLASLLPSDRPLLAWFWAPH